MASYKEGNSNNSYNLTGQYHDSALATGQYHVCTAAGYFDLRHRWATNGSYTLEYNCHIPCIHVLHTNCRLVFLLQEQTCKVTLHYLISLGFYLLLSDLPSLLLQLDNQPAIHSTSHLQYSLLVVYL